MEGSVWECGGRRELGRGVVSERIDCIWNGVVGEDGTKISCDQVVTVVGWTTRTSLLNMPGDRTVYSPQAARFFPDVDRLRQDVLVTGGIAGDGGLDELTEHATAIGAEAARRAGMIGRSRSLAVPTRAHPAPAGPAVAAPAAAA